MLNKITLNGLYHFYISHHTDTAQFLDSDWLFLSSPDSSAAAHHRYILMLLF